MLRFARKLRDAEHPSAPWADVVPKMVEVDPVTRAPVAPVEFRIVNTSRQPLLEAAVRFLVGVDESLDRAGLQNPKATEGAFARAFWDDLLLR